MKDHLRVFRTVAFAMLLPALALVGDGCSQFDMDLPEGEPSDLTVDELVAKMEKATDPQGLFKNCKSYILKQRVVDSGKFERDEHSLEIMFKAPHYMKYTSFKGGKAYSALLFNGERAWNIDPATNRSTEVSAGMGMNLVKTFAALATPGSSIKTVFKTVDIDMVMDKWDVRCYRLVCRVADSEIAPYIILVDASTYLTRSFETTLYGADGGTSPYVSYTGHYEMLGGVRMATETLVETGGKTVRSSLVSMILDAKIADDEFKLPVPFYEKPSQIQEKIEAAAGQPAAPAAQ